MLAKKMLEDISGGCLGEGISSIVEKITNVLNKHSARSKWYGWSGFIPVGRILSGS